MGNLKFSFLLFLASETTSQYDSILDSVFAEVGMTHHYVPFWERRPSGRIIIEAFDDHLISIRRTSRFLGVLPYSRNIEVARIESEPESAKPYSNGHFLRYGEVMVIRIIDPRYIRDFPLGQKIADALNAEVEII